jgi:hypothetical protein
MLIHDDREAGGSASGPGGGGLLKKGEAFVPSCGSPEGRYANGFRVGHNVSEFMIDFGQQEPDRHGAGERYHTRIVTVPLYAKELLLLLEDSIAEYEGAFGAIRAPEEDDGAAE